MKPQLLQRLTGGRPMTLVKENLFYDHIEQRTIHMYKDAFGRKWMAHSPWAWFRVSDPQPEEELKEAIKRAIQ